MSNTKLKLDVGRQYVLFGEVVIDFSNIVDTAIAVKAIDLPYGAEVTGGSVIVDTAFNPGTSMVLDIGDQLVPNRYLNDADLKTLARTPLIPTGYVSDGAAIFITPVIVGAVPTAGSVRVNVQYVIKNRADEVQPN